jgi:hypothetical protein
VSEKFEVVERPTMKPTHKDASPLSVAFVSAMKDEKAIRLELNGTSWHRVRQRLSSLCRQRGTKLRMLKQADGSYIAWAIKTDESSTQKVSA